jgi:hypothetical protein
MSPMTLRIIAFLKFYASIECMEAEEKKLLQETFELVQENNEMLVKIRNVQKREAAWFVFKLTITIGIILGTFYWLEPYINKILDIYGRIFDVQGELNNPTTIRDLLKSL